jgi:hypothetical protein
MRRAAGLPAPVKGRSIEIDQLFVKIEPPLGKAACRWKLASHYV